MSRLSGRVSWMLAGMAIVVLMAEVAQAQGGRRGRFGRGGFGRYIAPVQLVAEADEVRTALNVTPEQEEKIETINDERRDAVQEAYGGGGGRRAAMEEVEKLNQEASAKLAEVLETDQQKRLLGISIQVNGAAALNEPAVVKELDIADEQKAKLREVRDSNREAGFEAMRELRDQDLSQDEMREKMREIQQEGDKKVLAVLTSDQQAKFEQLKGEPVEIDMSQFRGRFGGGRGGRGGDDGDGGGRRGRRNRDNADSESST
jgi:Spy/CpxP family protein refolding chaperone